ncbi:DUF402 domain-containing protein [Paenibacillus agricola]|uniref:DUF402 domain-containing protein n=1 Tax=Paenibacillus agricola TaxID=2716264 RepID=A0ABX0JGE2_9BACL|nr:DUF402 domain-containing protein [Paenibacillus agricola]NHN34608.1 DUF402 domain-containing protein [Paenibacillus agricola]
MSNQMITIQALKYGGHLHYEWNTILLEQTDSYIFVLGEYGRKLSHYTKDQIFTVENWTIEFFSLDSWFTVSADIVEGKILQYYCNINQPATINGQVVSFVDLDLDLVYRNGKWAVVDEDEFASNTLKFGYPDELVKRARMELDSLQERIARKQFPFDGAIERFIRMIP